MNYSSRLVRLLGVFVVYQLAALTLYGLSLLARFSDYHAGSGPDPQFMLWSVAWWPYALAHHVNPMYTRLVWAPEGFDVIWSSASNLLSIAAAPLTLRFGPVASLNLLALSMPALSALAGFILTDRLVGQTAPALLGGYLYGFSPYMVGNQAGAHLGLAAAFMIPAVILLTLNRIEDRVSAVSFVLWLTLILVAQFLMGLELLASLGVFGAVALGIAGLFWPELRARLRSTAALIVLALLVMAVVLSPTLPYVLSGSGLGRHRVWANHGADLFELFVPGRFFLLGILPGLSGDATSYAHFSRDAGGYIGLPMAIVAMFFFRQRWGERRARFLAAMLAIVYIASLGPTLHFRGHELWVMPWKLFDRLPLINSAQAVRFTLYAHLLLALVASLWIAETALARAAKLVIAAILVVAILPNVRDQSLWASDLRTPEFFTSPALRENLRPGENVLLLPFSANGESMSWQALSGMYFATVGGWTGPTPRPFAAWPIMPLLDHDTEIPEAREQFLAFLAAHRVTAVIIDQRHPLAARWLALMDPRTTHVALADGVIIARPSPQALAPYRDATAAEMRGRLDASIRGSPFGLGR